jgi:hypothetical protein
MRYALMRAQFYTPSIFVLIVTLISTTLNGQSIHQDGNTYLKKTAELNVERKKFKSQSDLTSSLIAKKKIESNAGKFLLNAMIDTLIPYWYGTGWDFNGYTDKPGEGKIACGYFVSTTLKHAGFNLNRYKLAQKYSLSIVESLSCGDLVWKYNGLSAAEFINKSKLQLKDGLYVVGLESHVGFLLYEKGNVFFIHSNYWEPVAVVKEPAEKSLALNDSHVFVLCSISGNEKLLNKWINGLEVKIQP